MGALIAPEAALTPKGDPLVKRGFTLIELLVVIAIIAILAAILFPVFAKAREKARGASCLSNVKQITMGLMMYVQDHDMLMPYAGPGQWIPDTDLGSCCTERWYKSILPYVKEEALFKCPGGRADVGYVACCRDFGPGYMLEEFTAPSKTMILTDGPGKAWGSGAMILRPNDNPDTQCGGGANMRIAARHNEGLNCGYLDGHAKWNQATFSARGYAYLPGSRWWP